MTRVTALGCAAVAAMLSIFGCGGTPAPTRPSLSAPGASIGVAGPTQATPVTASWSCFTQRAAGTPGIFGAGVRDAACPAVSRTPLLGSRAAAAGGVRWTVASHRSPIELAGSVSGSTATLTWKLTGWPEAPLWFYFLVGSSSGAEDIADFDISGAARTLTATDVPAGTYYVRVYPADDDFYYLDGGSNEVAVTVGGGSCGGAPNAPTGLSTSVAGGTVSLAWNAPAGSCTPTGYVIEAGSAAGLSNLASFNTGSSATTFSAPGVPDGSYYVRVSAQNSRGTSAASNEAVLNVGPVRAAIAVVVTPNPVQYTLAQSTCNAGSGSWVYNQTIQETGGVGATVRSRTNVIDGTVLVTSSVNYAIPANGTFNAGTQTWCNTPAGASRASTVQTTWTGTDARGVPFSYAGPVVTLLANGTTTNTPRFFQATWVSASWTGGRTGTPLNSRGIDPPTNFGFLCPAKSLILLNHPENDTYESIGGAFYVQNISCTPTMQNVAFCRTAGTGGGASTIPICAIDPRQTPFNNMSFVRSVTTSPPPTGFVGSSPVNFDINVFWCSTTSRMNFGTYAHLAPTDCIDR